jgi:hypothetical protein
LIRNIIAGVDDTVVFMGTCQENTYFGWGIDENRYKESKEESYPCTTGQCNSSYKEDLTSIRHQATWFN